VNIGHTMLKSIAMHMSEMIDRSLLNINIMVVMTKKPASTSKIAKS
jgi:hypothetical protein